MKNVIGNKKPEYYDNDIGNCHYEQGHPTKLRCVRMTQFTFEL